MSLGKWIQIHGIHGKLYHFSQDRITFEKAKATCEHNFGKLFEPKTEAINNKIAGKAREKGINNPWIGIHHLHDEKKPSLQVTRQKLHGPIGMLMNLIMRIRERIALIYIIKGRNILVSLIRLVLAFVAR